MQERIFGIGYVVASFENDIDKTIEKAIVEREDYQKIVNYADKVKKYGLNYINLVGPLIFTHTQISPVYANLIQDVKERGLKISFCLNTYMDWEGKLKDKWGWIDRNGNRIDNNSFCMSNSYPSRVEEIKKCIAAGMDYGFDEVLLDFFDWGMGNEISSDFVGWGTKGGENRCFCPSCIEKFNLMFGYNYKQREQLAEDIKEKEHLKVQWYEFKCKIRNKIGWELREFAIWYGRKRGTEIKLSICMGGIGGEINYTTESGLFDAICPMTYGSVVAGTIESYESITQTYRKIKEYIIGQNNINTMPQVIAFLNAGWVEPPPLDTPAKELYQLAIAAINGESEGWVFFPASKIEGEDWEALSKAVKIS